MTEPGRSPPADAAALATAVAELVGGSCRTCGRILCGHDTVLSILLGYRNAPHCAGCLGHAMGEPIDSLRERTVQWILRRDCYLSAWRAASDAEGSSDPLRPPCVFDLHANHSRQPAPEPDATATTPEHVAAWDAADLGCGELVLQLRLRLVALAPGSVLRLRATDPAAPVDIPAWCGLTGHALLHQDHPLYWIRRKET